MVIIIRVLIDFTQNEIKVHKRGCRELDNKRSIFLLHFSNG